MRPTNLQAQFQARVQDQRARTFRSKIRHHCRSLFVVIMFVPLSGDFAAAQEKPFSPTSAIPITTAQHTSPLASNLFSRPGSMPIPRLEDGEMVCLVHFSQLAAHPMMPAVLAAIEDQARGMLAPHEDGTAANLGEFGLILSEIEKIHAIGQVSLRYVADAPNDANHTLSMGANQFMIETKNPVDWPALLRQVRPDLVREMSQLWESLIAELQPGTVFRNGKSFAEGEAKTRQESAASDLLSQRTASLFHDVAGGISTAVIDVPDVTPLLQNSASLDPEERKWFTIASHFREIAVGTDYSPDSFKFRMRGIVTGAPGVSEQKLLEAVQSLRDKWLFPDGNENSAPSWAKSISNLQWVAGSDERYGTRVEFALELDPRKLDMP